MRYSISIFFSFLVSAALAQSPMKDSIDLNNAERDGKIMAMHLLNKEYKSFVKYTHPAVVKMMGGEEKMIAVLEKEIRGIEDEGFSFVTCKIERPTAIVRIKDQQQCTVSQTITMKTPKGRMTTRSTLIAVSFNNGESWTFIDTHGKPLKDIQAIIPGLSRELVIPKKEEPVMIVDN